MGDTVAFENQVWTNHAPAEGGRENHDRSSEYGLFDQNEVPVHAP
jgi:hypothetical protein